MHTHHAHSRHTWLTTALVITLLMVVTISSIWAGEPGLSLDKTTPIPTSAVILAGVPQVTYVRFLRTDQGNIFATYCVNAPDNYALDWGQINSSGGVAWSMHLDKPALNGCALGVLFFTDVRDGEHLFVTITARGGSATVSRFDLYPTPINLLNQCSVQTDSLSPLIRDPRYRWDTAAGIACAFVDPAAVGLPTPTPTPPAAVHTNTGLRAIIENGKTTVLLKVCGQGNNYRFRSTIASTGQVLFDGVYGAINGCSPEYKAVINASPGETLRFYTTVMNGAISDQEFLQRRRDSCRIDAAGVMRCLVGDTLPPPLPAKPIDPPPPPEIKPCEVPFFAQNDPQWKNHPLRTGHNPQQRCSALCGTIGACGCTLTSTAMVLRYYGADTDPRRLSDCMGNRACLFVWDAAHTSCSDRKVTGRQGYWGFSYLKLEQALKDGPVVLGMSKGNNTHFVVVVSGSGSNPDNYVINDPALLQGAKLRLSSYTSRGWSLGDFHRYVGTRPTCPATAAAPETAPAVSEVSGSGETYTGGAPATTPHAFRAATVTGSAAVLTMDERTYTLELAAQSDGGPIMEMRLSSDTKPNMDWQPFTPYVVMEAGDSVTVEFKDASGNVSAPITVNPHMFQVEPLAIEDYPVYLPMITR